MRLPRQMPVKSLCEPPAQAVLLTTGRAAGSVDQDRPGAGGPGLLTLNPQKNSQAKDSNKGCIESFGLKPVRFVMGS